MKRWYVLAAAVLLCLTACNDRSNEPSKPVWTEPTLPQIDQTQPPQQLLRSAIAGLDGKELTYFYGCGWQKEWTMTQGTAEDFRSLVPNQELIAQFCALPMMAIPSKDGTICYQATELSPEQVCQLVCDRSLTSEEQQSLSAYPDAEGTVQISVDEKGVFRFLQVDILLHSEVWRLKLQVEY